MFCPRCRAEYRAGFSVCRECEVPLVGVLPGPAAADEPAVWLEDRELVTVFREGDPSRMLLACSLLEDAGIPFSRKGEGVQDLFGAGRLGLGYSAVVGPPELQVGPQDEGRARAVLEALPEPPASEAELTALAETAREPDIGPPRGIGGVLSVLAVVVVVYPFWIAYGLSELFVHWNAREWREATDPSSAAYHPLWGPYRWGWLAWDSVLFLASLVILYGFRQRKRWLPPVMIAFLVAHLLGELGGLLPLWLVPVIRDNTYAGDFRDVVLIGGLDAVWVSYLLLSERVRATFTE